MKLLIQFAWPVIKVVGGYTLLVVSAYMAIDTWAVNKAQTVVGPVRKEMMAIRGVDFQHFNSRFDRTEEKLDMILKEIKNK